MGQGLLVQQGSSPAEIAARVVAGLIDLTERRTEAIDRLSAAVRSAVAELDPDGKRNTDPTWWDDHKWVRPDALDRLRLGHDRLLVLEVQAAEIVTDLRGMLALRPVGSPERPSGYTPAKAHAVLLSLGERRPAMLTAMLNAERPLRCAMKPETSLALRRALRDLSRFEQLAQQAMDRLTALLGIETTSALAGRRVAG